MAKINEGEQYKWVNHLGEAAALVLLGYEVQVTRLNPFNNMRKQTQFGFERTVEIELHSKQYWDGTLALNAMGYYEAINTLRKERYDLENGLVVAAREDSNITNLKN